MNPQDRFLVRPALSLLLVSALALGGCSAMNAQNPSSSLRPVNAVAVGSDDRVMRAGPAGVA